MEVGQKVFIVDMNYNITESVVSKVTRSQIRLENGDSYQNNSWTTNGVETYTNRLNGTTMVKSRKNAERFIRRDTFEKFKTDSYRNIKYPSKPIAPKMKSMTPTMGEISKYQAEITEYETAIKVYTEETKIANDKMNAWMETYLAFLSDRDGLDEYPKEVQDAVYAMAYDQGHAYGYEEIAIYHNRYAEFAIKIINAVNKNK